MQRNLLIFLLCLFLINFLPAQEPLSSQFRNRMVDLGEVNPNDQNFEAYGDLKQWMGDAEIVLLGEQSHGEGTAFQTKIKMIQYLHEEMGFDILVFESGFYSCRKAWAFMEKGVSAKDALGKSVYALWMAMKELEPLTEYVDEELKGGNPLIIMGFDCHFTGSISREYYLPDLKTFLGKAAPATFSHQDWPHLEQSLDFVLHGDFKNAKKQKSPADTVLINELVAHLETRPDDPEWAFWAQELRSTKSGFSDMIFETAFRDRQMANNLIWIKETHPDSKIICWGATSHFLTNSTAVKMKSPLLQLLVGKELRTYKMMGTYLKEYYEEKVYSIGFTAYEGDFAMLGKRKRKIRPASLGTLESLLYQTGGKNLLLPLEGLTLEGKYARPLGNKYIKNDVAGVMDAIVFNRKIAPPELDLPLMRSIKSNFWNYEKSEGEGARE